MLIIVSFKQCYEQQTCSQAIENFPEYICIAQVGPNEYEINQEEVEFTIQNKNNKIYYLLIVKKALSQIEYENKFIYYVKQLQESRFVIKYIDSKIKDEYAYLITEKPKYGRLVDLITENNYFNTTDKIISFMKELLLSVSYLHSKGIVHANLSPWSIYLKENYEIALSGFDLAMKFNSKYDRKTNVKYEDPYIQRIKKFKTYRFNEKTDVWSIGKILYYIIHKKKLKMESRPSNNLLYSIYNAVLVDSMVDNDFIEIMCKCLKIKPSLRIPMLDLHNMFYRTSQRLIRTKSKTQLYINLDRAFPLTNRTFMEMFSELIIIIFIVLLVIPLTVFFIGKKVKLDQTRLNRNANINN